MVKKVMGIEQAQDQIPTFSTRQERRLELRNIWNERRRNPLAFVPYQVIEEGDVDPRQAIAENWAVGTFAANFKKMCFRERRNILYQGNPPPSTTNDKLVSVGYGNGYDYTSNGLTDNFCLKDAFEAGLATWVFDVSNEAVEDAKEALYTEAGRLIVERGIPLPAPQIYEAEIEELLEDPDSCLPPNKSLDLSTVKVWDLTRVIGCLMPRSSGENVMRLLGRSLGEEWDPDKTNRIIIITDLLDYNPEAKSKTTVLYLKHEIVSLLSEGANREVKIFTEPPPHKYWTKNTSAMWIGAE